MLKYLDNLKIKLREWSIKHVLGMRAKLWLAILSFSEASFFLIPPDVLLIAILGANAQRWIYYSSFTTFFSVLGGLFGYILGFWFFDTIGQSLISFYNLQKEMMYVSNLFLNNSFWVIFFSALTPIPYKVFTISAGFFKINILIFMIASILGRGLRFFVVGFVMKKFGKEITRYFFKYFNIISVLIILLIVLIFFF